MASEEWDMVSFECGVVAVVTRQESLIRVCFVTSVDAAAAAVKNDYPDAVQVTEGYTQVVLKQLKEFFKGLRRDFNLNLCNDSLSDFAIKVHQELMKVSLGTVVSYGELASKAGSPGAARAVGSVMAANPFPLIVPCHRVLKADGKVGQYSGAHGGATKTWLLDFENRLAADLTS